MMVKKIPKISVVMPVYNTGEILRASIDSILLQTFDNFELIMVDDGSADDTYSICEQYAAQDGRIVLLHQENKGVCAARNRGIEVSRGEYVTFCDHDDIYSPRKLEVQYLLAKKYDADIVNVGYETIYNSEKRDTEGVDLCCRGKDDISREFFRIAGSCLGTVWVKLYKKTTFDGIFRFDTKYARGEEDVNFNYRLLQRVSVFVSSKDVLYSYVVRDAYSTSQNIYPVVVEGMCDEIMAMHHYMQKNDIDAIKRQSEYRKVLSRQVAVLCVYMIKCGFSYEKFASVLDSIKQPLRLVERTYCDCRNLRNDMLLYLVTCGKCGSYVVYATLAIAVRIKCLIG